jgi:hypothetical protein
VSLHERPICYQCDSPIEENAEILFAAPCDHDRCPSAVWHGLCLMQWREHREVLLERRRQWLSEHYVSIQIWRPDGGTPEPPPD